MKQVKIQDKEFDLYITASTIEDRIAQIAISINRELAGCDIVFLGILNGSFMFASDLFKQIELNSKISFLKMASYQGTTGGTMKQLIGINESLQNKTVVVIEDIVDTGITMKQILIQLEELKPKAIKICTLLFKPQALIVPLQLDYVGFEIPNEFVVGYGLDYNGYGRNLTDIYKLPVTTE